LRFSRQAARLVGMPEMLPCCNESHTVIASCASSQAVE
jgi:hypothetical protein